MRILVAHASRMGSTAEIAQRVADQLSEAGNDVDVSPCADAADAGGYAAVIVGSALYLGRWEKSALSYLKVHAAQLRERPTWLFQSGPCGAGSDVRTTGTPRAVTRLTKLIGVAPPVTFGGRLERSRARTRVSRWMASGTYAGDFRDWEQVGAWTAEILARLEAARPAVPTDRQP